MPPPEWGAFLLPLWWTDTAGVCQCPKRTECPSPGKHPLTEDGLDDASNDPATIAGWWKTWPRANVGERTDGLVRIDIALVDVAEALSNDVALPATTQVIRTPCGGMHIAVECEGPVRSRTLYLSDGRKLGEVKADRAYVLIPPSVIGTGIYTAMSPPDVPPMKVDDAVTWLSDLLPLFGYRLGTSERGRRRDYEDLAGTIHEGAGRHNALVSYAGHVWIQGMASGTLADLLAVINQRQCQPPLLQDEVEAIAEHFVANRQQRPLGVDPALSGAPELPCIVTSNRRLREIAADAWQALLAGNSPPRYFQHGGAIAEIGRDDVGRARIAHLGFAGLKGHLDRCADWVTASKDGPRPARPPRDVVEDLEAMAKPLPVLRGVVGTPIFSVNGTLTTEAGYQPATRLYYEPSGDPVPSVPTTPDATDLQRARMIIGQDWLGDFPFVDDASRAHAIAAVVTAVGREMIDGPTPLFAFDAPAAGTGKGLLALGVGLIVTGSLPAVMTEVASEEELRKRITAVLCAGPSVVLFDNIKRRLASGTLAGLLTAPWWSDRILGKSQTVDLPVRGVWLVTGNNLELDNETARRTVWIRLDAQCDRPWERTQFRHSDLNAWLRRHRHELIWAHLVLVQHWISAGRPGWAGRPLGSFEAWSAVVGGVLQAAGIGGFLANREELYRRVDVETEEWRAFARWWWERRSDQAVKATELLAGAQDLLLTLFEKAKPGASEQALKTRLGKAIAAKRDQRLGGLFIRQAGEDAHSKGVLWRLERADDDADPAEVERLSALSSAQPPHDNGPIFAALAEGAEVAEVDPGVDPLFSDELATERNQGGTGISPPQPPHPPELSFVEGLNAAEGVRRIAAGEIQPPRCRTCQSPMSSARVSDLCGWCQKA